MEQAKLPMPYAIRLEMIRAKGYTEEGILEILHHNEPLELLAMIDPDVNWDSFIHYCQENREIVQGAVLNGYQFKFITIGGIRNLLSIRFHKEEGTDYRIRETELAGLKLNAEEIRQLRNLIPEIHWKFILLTADHRSGEIGMVITLANPALLVV